MTSLNKTIIIAEAGVNHNGSMELAKKLIDVASEAGADFVKFQTFDTEKLVTKSAAKARYQIKNTNDVEGRVSQFEMLKKLELSESDHIELYHYCESVGIRFLSTPFGEEAADFLTSIVPFFKIPSGELTNLPFLEYLSRKGLPIVLSTGMGSMEEVKEAVNCINDNWNSLNVRPRDKTLSSGKRISPLTILHCNTCYPTPLKDVNLKAMTALNSQLGLPVGYSDHTLSTIVPAHAVILGASLIEKHITLDRTMEGPDHAASLEPLELKAMIKNIFEAELILGNGKKSPSDSEMENINVARKSLVYNASYEAGRIIDDSCISVKRPGGGLAPSYLKNIVGKKLLITVQRDQQVSLDQFE